MKKSFLLLIIVIGFIGLVLFVLPPQGWKAKLITPIGQTRQNSDVSAPPLPTPNAPKTFQFDSSTDLKMELEKINPQVLESDFE